MKIHLFTAITAAAMLCGCNFCTEVPLMNIEYAENITIDGIVDEKCWQNAQQYALGVSGSAMNYKHPSLAKHYGNRVLSPGYVKMLHDRNYLYISAVMQDDDIIAYGKRDQQIHCTEGDVFEIFLKPENANHYWEIHITPAGHCAVLFYPSRISNCSSLSSGVIWPKMLFRSSPAVNMARGQESWFARRGVNAQRVLKTILII